MGKPPKKPYPRGKNISDNKIDIEPLKLLSFIPSSDIMETFDNSWKNIDNYIKNLNLDGIETMIGTYHPTEYLEGIKPYGLHLMYFPTWMDFWNEDTNKLIENFGSLERVKKYFGGTCKTLLVEHYKKEFDNAKKLGVEYMVFHVSHVNPREIFTFDHHYSSREVIDAAVELINEVFTGEGPFLLLENLFWPGLDLRCNEDTRYLLDSINYKNKGLLLDLSHLICTNKNIATFDEGANFILNRLAEMGSLVDCIMGIHLNASTPKEYLNQSFKDKLRMWEKADSLERYKLEGSHIKNIDTHSVFESYKLMEILNKVPYKFLTLELSYDTVEDLTEKIQSQLKYLD